MKIIDEIIEREGGYNNDPDDGGGPTNFGITLERLKTWRNDDNLIAEDVEFMSENEARNIYKVEYIEEPGFNLIENEQVRALIVDTGVMSGPTRVTKWLQTIIKVKVDGNLGPITAGAVNEKSPHEIIRRFSVWRIKFYVRVATKNTTQLKWLKGWVNRASSFLLY